MLLGSKTNSAAVYRPSDQHHSLVSTVTVTTAKEGLPTVGAETQDTIIDVTSAVKSTQKSFFLFSKSAYMRICRRTGFNFKHTLLCRKVSTHPYSRRGRTPQHISPQSRRGLRFVVQARCSRVYELLEPNISHPGYVQLKRRNYQHKDTVDSDICAH